MNINDILCVTERHKELAVKLIQGLSVNLGIIAIAGESGTGKSEVASLVAPLFEAIILPLDQYYIIPDYKRTAWRRKNFKDIGPLRS